jgi:hypothetical protein
MTERLLHFIWQFQYYNRDSLCTTSGELLSIEFPGNYNTDQGPDFSAASIRINQVRLVGNIELHVQASDWNRHAHQHDHHYHNVILHVVWKNDAPIQAVNHIATLVLEDRVPKLLLQRYEQLMANAKAIPCHAHLPVLSEVSWMAWKERLAIERLQVKSQRVLAWYEQSNHHWEEVFWWMLATSFGATKNTQLFEEVAKSIGVNILAKHKNQIHQLEALLLGQANLLEGRFEDKYAQMLQREYQFYQHKHALKKVCQAPAFLRMRPASFPTVRLAQLAMLIFNSCHLFSKMKEQASVKDVKQLLNVTANDYWHYHYRFDEETAYLPKNLGMQMMDNIVINTIVPVLFAYGLYHKDQAIKDKALSWLQETAAEQNNITKTWKVHGIGCSNALESQALIQLHKQYCLPKNCLTCALGTKLLGSR